MGITDERNRLKHLALELSGVIADVEQGDGFDAVCLGTLKRVRAALFDAAALEKDAALPALPVVPAMSFQQWGEDVKRWHGKMIAAFDQSVRDGSSYEFGSFDGGYTAGVSDALTATPETPLEATPGDMKIFEAIARNYWAALLVVPSLSAINDLAKVYASSYASPHHITFTVDGLRAMLSAAPQPGNAQQENNDA